MINAYGSAREHDKYIFRGLFLSRGERRKTRISNDCSLPVECVVAAPSYFDCISLLITCLTRARLFPASRHAMERVNEHGGLHPRDLLYIYHWRASCEMQRIDIIQKRLNRLERKGGGGEAQSNIAEMSLFVRD